MRASFLHISDFHFTPSWPEELELVYESFQQDLVSEAKKETDLFAVFSGDLVREGAIPSHFEQFSSKIANTLEAAGIPYDRRIVVPGNHDVSRNAIEKTLPVQKPALDNIKSELQFNNSLELFSKQFLNENFENYKQGEKDFGKFTSCQGELGGTGWRIKNSIGVYCLNTALCSFGAIIHRESGSKINDRNRLMIDTRALHSWLRQNDSEFKILVMHHPLDWLCDWAASELDTVIDRNFDLVFTGHIHSSSAKSYSSSDSKVVQIGAPPLFTRKSSVLGYSMVTVDLSSQNVKVRYRQWSEAHHKFLTGTALSGTDSGEITLSTVDRIIPNSNQQGEKPFPNSTNKIILEDENKNTQVCDSSIKPFELNSMIRAFELSRLKNAFRIPATDNKREKRVRQLIERECSQENPRFRLIASSGFNYISSRGKVWNAGLGDAVMSAKAKFEVILASPFSEFAITRALANHVTYDQWNGSGIPVELEKFIGMDNVSIGITGFPINCSLFFTSTSVFYDPYIWGHPDNKRTENNFWVLEFEKHNDLEHDCYQLLERHYAFLAGVNSSGSALKTLKPKPIEEFLGKYNETYDLHAKQFKSLIEGIQRGEYYDPTIAF